MKYLLVVFGSIALAAWPSPRSQSGLRDPSAVLARVRQALGGEERLASVRSFVATGRTRRLQGDNLVPLEFEIACQLPDKYVRRDEIPAQESGPTSRGFNGPDLIQLPPPASRGSGPTKPPDAARGRGDAPGGARAGTPPPGTADAPPGRGTVPAFVAPKSDPLSTAKQDFVRLTLGIFAKSFDTYPLTFTWIGEAEAPQGKAQVIEVRGPEGSNFQLRWFIDGQTHRPIMLSWQMPAVNVVVSVPGQSKPSTVAPGTVIVEGPPVPSATATKEEVEKFSKAVADLKRKAQSTLLEHRLYYGDYREQDGLQIPFRLRRAIGAGTIEETNFDSFRINPRIDPRKFEVSK